MAEGKLTPTVQRALVEEYHRRQTAPVFAINAFGAVSVAAFLWNQADAAALTIWTLMVFAVTLAGWSAQRHFARAARLYPTVRWRQLFIYLSGVNGVFWGAAAVVFHPGGGPEQMMIVTYILAMGGGASSVRAPIPAAALAFIVPSFSLAAGRAMAEGTPFHTALAAWLAAALALAYSFLSANHRALVESIRLRQENEAMARQLERRELRLRRLVENVRDVIVVVDATGAIRFANPAAEEALTGYRRGRRLTEWLEPDSAGPAAALIAATATGAAAAAQDLILRDAGGRRRAMHAVAGRIETGDGGDGVVLTLRDVTDRKQAEEALRAAKRDAEAGERAKSLFIATASHDLRQPLHAMALLLGSLARKVRGAGTRALVADLRGLLADTSDMFAAILDLSRLEAGQTEPRPEAFAVQELFDRLAARFREPAAAQGLRLAFVPTAAWVHSDPAWMERIMANLVSNAVRHTAAGGAVVGCRRRGSRLRLEVWDSGPGIADDMVAAMFQPFHSGDPQGIGLGLAIAQRLALRLGHRLDCRTRPGRGTCFAVEAPAATAQPRPQPAAAPRLGLSGKRVAVLDDDPRVRAAICAAIGHWGGLALGADGIEGLVDALGDARPDAAVLDYHLADGRTGLEAAAALRARYGAGLPCVVVTADSSAQRRAQVEAAGCQILLKPVIPGRLAALLRHATRRSRRPRPAPP